MTASWAVVAAKPGIWGSVLLQCQSPMPEDFAKNDPAWMQVRRLEAAGGACARFAILRQTVPTNSGVNGANRGVLFTLISGNATARPKPTPVSRQQLAPDKLRNDGNQSAHQTRSINLQRHVLANQRGHQCGNATKRPSTWRRGWRRRGMCTARRAALALRSGRLTENRAWPRVGSVTLREFNVHVSRARH